MVRQYFQAQYEADQSDSLPGLIIPILLIVLIFISFNAYADESASILKETAILSQEAKPNYQINAGDVLSISVWNDPSFNAEQLLVRPDGFISAPAVGEIKAGGQTIDQLQKDLAESLSRYLKDEPTVVITILSTNGSQIFVLGKVNAPGAYPLTGRFDVTQAIAMARGLNSFAKQNKIKVLRRNTDGVQQAFTFMYAEVVAGRDLSSNILLNSGDVVVVP